MKKLLIILLALVHFYLNANANGNNHLFHFWMKASYKSCCKSTAAEKFWDTKQKICSAVDIFLRNPDDIILSDKDKEIFDHHLRIQFPSGSKMLIWDSQKNCLRDDNMELERCCQIKRIYVFFAIIAYKMNLMTWERVEKICRISTR